MPNKESYLAHYKSPNIVIIPTTPLCYPPSPKRPKVEIPLQSRSPQHADLSFLDDFNVDEIVECLNNCDDNDTTIQGLTHISNVNETSLQSSEHKVIALRNENKINNNNDQKPIISQFSLKNVQNCTFDENHEQNDQKKIILSLKNENDNETIHKTITVSNVECNLQSDAKMSVQLPCAMIKIIEKDKILCNSEEPKYLNNVADKYQIVEKEINENCVGTKEVVDNKPIISVPDKKDTEENKSNCTHSETKNIKNQEEAIIKHKNIEKKVFIQNNDSKAPPRIIIKRKMDIALCKKLENTMLNYLHIKYSVESVVHYGNFSKIFKCKDYAGKQYAVKMLNKPDRFCHGIKKEQMFVDIQADIPKENLFCIYCANSFSINGYWCYLMEFYPKNLKQAILESSKPFHIDLVQDLGRQLVAAVTVLRNKNIVHSDIKPSHILLNSSKTVLKLCGFDNSYYINEASIRPNIGSINYRPPEVILGYSADFSVDVWSTALVLHEMSTGHQLFPGYYNWDILYKQMCTLGNIPPEMLHESVFKNRYFVGGMFKKRFGIKGQKTVLMYNFNKNNKLSRTVYGAYYCHWAPLRTKVQKTNDLKKSNLLIRLLEQMLVICPNYRISIEFVYANPFIYEMFD